MASWRSTRAWRRACSAFAVRPALLLHLLLLLFFCAELCAQQLAQHPRSVQHKSHGCCVHVLQSKGYCCVVLLHFGEVRAGAVFILTACRAEISPRYEQVKDSIFVPR